MRENDTCPSLYRAWNIGYLGREMCNLGAVGDVHPTCGGCRMIAFWRLERR